MKLPGNPPGPARRNGAVRRTLVLRRPHGRVPRGVRHLPPGPAQDPQGLSQASPRPLGSPILAGCPGQTEGRLSGGLLPLSPGTALPPSLRRQSGRTGDRRCWPRGLNLVALIVKALPALALATVVLAGMSVVHAADPELARNLAATCANCHGTGGHSVGGMASLAGEPREQLLAKLRGYASGEEPSTRSEEHTSE